MSNSASQENRSEATRALVEHLRQNPHEADGDPAALAARFGLDPGFVRRALAHRSSPKAEPDRGPHPLVERAGGVASLIQGMLERAAENPLRFEAVSLFALIGLSVALRTLPRGASDAVVTFRSSLFGLLALLSVAVQMSVFFRRRMVRYALYGGLLFGAVTGFPVMVAVWLNLREPDSQVPAETTRGFIVFLSGLLMLAVGGVYAGLAALASLAGGWLHIRRQELAWERLSRQELLERYFSLQSRLDQSVTSPDEPQVWETWRPVATVRRRPELAGGLLGLVTGLLQVSLGLLYGVQAAQGTHNGVFNLLYGLEVFVAIFLFVVVGFLSGRASRGAATGLAFVGGILVSHLTPLGGFGPGFVATSSRLSLAGAEFVAMAFLGTLAGAGATIQRRAAREARLQRNDGATLVAEMLEIQRRLEEDATRVVVLVVDAAKSTAMKVGADPLDVEYSFREYQTWIGECCAEFSGRIHSIAGDGAVVAFPSGETAMAAARRIQTDLARFNAEYNRLPKPFRLRLGLHAGRVAGDLNDVQFTEVIDIAAHVEEIAPVGGIAATGAVVSGIGEEGFLPLARDVDGQPVYIALVPMEA